MPAAFNPDVEQVDQTEGAHPSHTAQGSRFTTLDSRMGNEAVSMNVNQLALSLVEAIKQKTFTIGDLKHVAFEMNCQIVEGKDSNALAIKVIDLETKVGAAEHRALMAETAFAGKEKLTAESLTAIASTMGLEVSSKADADALRNSVSELTTRANEAEAALAAATSAKADAA